MAQSRQNNEPRTVTLTTAVLMAGGGLIAGMIVCLCAGTFALVLTSSARGFNRVQTIVPPLAGSAGGGSIEVGESVSGAIWSLSAEDEWTFEGEAGQEVTIEVRADQSSDPWVWLIGPSGAILGDNDDSFGGLDSYLHLTLPDDGTYTIRIEMLSTGGYTLSLND